MSKLMTCLMIVLLVFALVLCVVASFWGWGVRQIGPRHIRSGSLFGPSVSGGGPGSGK